MPSTPHVAILAPVHPYYDIRVFQKEAKTLARAGYAVTLLARADQAMTEDGVTVLPLRYKQRWQRFVLQPWLLWKVLRSGARLVHLHNPDTLPIGFALKLFGRKVVYDTHENYRLLLRDKEWLPAALRPPLATLIDSAEKLATRAFDQVIVTQRAQAERFGGKTLVIENPPITQGPLIEEAHRLSHERQRGDELRLCYVGLIKEDRGLFQMVEAMEHLNAHHPARLWLIGNPADPELITRAGKLHGWQFVDYLGRQAQAEAFSYVIAADACLAVFQPWGDNEHVNINKLFEAALFGKPVIASDFPAWRAYVEGVSCAIFVDPRSPEAIAEAAASLAADPIRARAMGTAGQSYVCEHYNWELESQKLLELYQRLSAR